MNSSISLDHSPPLERPLAFMAMAFIGFFLASLYMLNFANEINDRWDQKSIVLTHLFTLGFMLPLAMGSLTQLLPVLFGLTLNYQKLIAPVKNALPIALLFFAFYFHHFKTDHNYLLLAVLIVFWILLLRFSIVLIFESFKKYLEVKNITFLFLVASFIHFIFALLISVLLILAHWGIDIPSFRPHLTDLHLKFMLVGFFFNLLYSVLTNVIPMFYVISPPSPAWSKFILVSTTGPLLTSIFQVDKLTIFLNFITMLGLLSFLYVMTYALKHRKRKRRDPVILLWYFFFFNFSAFLILWILNDIGLYELSNLRLGLHLFLLIVFWGMITMLLKIIPFLHWMHLNQLSTQLTISGKTHFIEIPTIKDFISDSDIYSFAILMIVLIPAVWITSIQMLSVLCITLIVWFCYLLIKTKMIYQRTVLQLNEI